MKQDETTERISLSEESPIIDGKAKEAMPEIRRKKSAPRTRQIRWQPCQIQTHQKNRLKRRERTEAANWNGLSIEPWNVTRVRHHFAGCEGDCHGGYSTSATWKSMITIIEKWEVERWCQWLKWNYVSITPSSSSYHLNCVRITWAFDILLRNLFFS
jgi:hypothetical protein